MMHGIKQKIAGTIKSLDPPCTGKSSGNSKHPSTCDNCHMQEHYLVDLFNKRSDAKLKNTAGASRIGERGVSAWLREEDWSQTPFSQSWKQECIKSSLCTKEKGNECPKLGGNAARKQPAWIPGETYSWPSHIAQARRCSCDGFCGANEQEAGEHVTCRLADGNLERIRRLFSNL